MSDINEIVRVLQDRVDQFASARGYDDSYAYRFGAFVAATTMVFDGLLTDKQLIELNKRVTELYKGVI